jgi:hypothetical protein
MFILGLAGQAGVGKDTVADYLVKAYGFVKFAFSDALYAEVQAAYGLEDQSLLRDRATKEVPTERLALKHCTDEGFLNSTGYLLAPDIKTKVDHSPLSALSPRQVLQWWGTQYRRAQDPHYWLWQNENWLHKVRADHLYPEHAPQHFVNTTVRFENEREWIHAGGWENLWQGNVWHIRREGLAPVASHVSETELPVITPERQLWNNASIERLYRGVDLLMSTHARFVRVEPMAPYALLYPEAFLT